MDGWSSVKRNFLFPSFDIPALYYCYCAWLLSASCWAFQSRNGCGRYSDAPLVPAIAAGGRVSFLNCTQRLRNRGVHGHRNGKHWTNFERGYMITNSLLPQSWFPSWLFDIGIVAVDLASLSTLSVYFCHPSGREADGFLCTLHMLSKTPKTPRLASIGLLEQIRSQISCAILCYPGTFLNQDWRNCG